MSQTTLDNLMRAALTTRGQAIADNPTEEKPWETLFNHWLSAHLLDEYARLLSAGECIGYLASGGRCSGRTTVVNMGIPGCLTCEVAKLVKKYDDLEVNHVVKGV